MQTPPSTPPRTTGRIPMTSQMSPGSPGSPGSPRSPISCLGLLSSGFNRKGGIDKSTLRAKSPPPQPKKPQKKRPYSEIYAWLLLFKGLLSKSSKLLGKGDFGTVSEVRLPNIPGTPQSPPIAVKEIKFDTPGVCSTDLREEVKRLGSPGCVPGVACRTEESVKIFMPLGVPLDKLDFSKMTAEMLEWVIQSVKNICTKKLDIGLLADIKPQNFIFLPKGTATVIEDSEGQPCMGPLTENDEVVYCDLGSVDPTSGGTKKYGVLPLVESDAERAEFESKLRTFKETMMEALIRDAANPSGKPVEEIVAECVPEGLAYASGAAKKEQYQAQQLLF
jgi:hypothetical protein